MNGLRQRIDGHVLTIELAREDCGNALNRALQRELAEAWENFEVDENLRVAVLRGAPNVFSIGHDVAELAADATASPVADEGMYPLHLSKPVPHLLSSPRTPLAPFAPFINSDARASASSWSLKYCNFAKTSVSACRT